MAVVVWKIDQVSSDHVGLVKGTTRQNVENARYPLPAACDKIQEELGSKKKLVRF